MRKPAPLTGTFRLARVISLGPVRLRIPRPTPPVCGPFPCNIAVVHGPLLRRVTSRLDHQYLPLILRILRLFLFRRLTQLKIALRFYLI